MVDGCHVGKYLKCHNSTTSGPTGTQLGWSHPITFSTCPPYCRCHGNGRCLWTAHWTFCSYGRLEAERANQFLMKFGTQPQGRTTMTVTCSNIKIFKLQNGGWPPSWKIFKNAINRLPMDRLWRNLGGHIPSCSRHVRHVAVTMATAVA